MKKIPLVDLSIPHKKLITPIHKAIDRIVAKSSFVMGEDVSLFEEEFARYCEVPFCIGVANGTVAIHAALEALGVGEGDEVITVTNTFIATSEAITQSGARAVFCDIDPLTHTIDPKSLQNAITRKTKAVIVVHLYGNPCDMDPILKLVKKHKLYLIEDAAQAHGATYKGKKIGSFGDVATFSFYPGKNLGAWGDAGAIVTKHEKLSKKLKKLINHGRIDKYTHEFEGFNYRLDSIQAAILRIKLKHLDEGNGKRRKNVQYYKEKLKNVAGLRWVEETPDAHSVFHLFVILHEKRDLIKALLAKHHVEAGIHYPLPLHLQPAYAYMKHQKGDFPIAEQMSEVILSLPIYPELTTKQIDTIVQYVKKATITNKK